MDALGIETAILSLPPNSTGIVSSQNRIVARAHNDFAALVCKEHNGRFRFFASLPFIDDTTGDTLFPDIRKRSNLTLGNFTCFSIGALEEIAYALDVLDADGIALTSSYGEGANASESQ